MTQGRTITETCDNESYVRSVFLLKNPEYHPFRLQITEIVSNKNTAVVVHLGGLAVNQLSIASLWLQPSFEHHTFSDGHTTQITFSVTFKVLRGIERGGCCM